MPTTLPPEARELRSDLADLTGLALADLGVVWRDLRTPDDAKVALRDVVPRLVAVYGAAAGSLAADWYDDLRDSRGVGRRFRAVVPEVPDAGADELAGFAVGPLYQAESDWDRALVLAGGGVQLRIANVSRATVLGSVREDPRGSGWQRVGGGSETCDWCAERIGAVYPASSAGHFGAHDNDQCAALPLWDS